MKLYEFTRYCHMDDELKTTLIFAQDINGAYEELFGYPLPEKDIRRTYHKVKVIPVKKGTIELTYL